MVEIFTYGNGTMLIALFQAITALTSTNDYLELIRLVFVISTLVVAIEITWTGRFKATGRLFAIIFMFNAAILTTTDVTVNDRVIPGNGGIVADVPAGLAAPLAVTTAIGDWATGAFETVFAMPNDLRYQSNGLLFASRLVDASTQFEITDSRLANNLAEFSQGCIYYGVMAGWFSIDTVMESGNIWAALPAASFGNAIIINYEDAAGNVVLTGCRDARTLINGDWAVAIDEMQSVFGQRIFPEYSEVDAKARLVASLPQSYLFMSNIASNAADIVRQNAMVNAIRRSFSHLANVAGASGAAQDYALAQAEAQQRTTYSTLGALAGRMMSLFSNVLETLIYGIFPIAFIFTLIALLQGKAILMYFKLLFWLQLWPPMFAILNFAMSTYGADASTAAAMQAGGGASILNMLTYTGMRAVNADMSAMAGYLSWMIPMFSWAIVSGSGFAASQLAASLGSVAQSSGSTAAAAASTGNISLGNYSGYNSRMFQTSHSPSMNRGLGTYVNPNTGATMTTSAGGYQTMSTPQNNTPFAANLSSAIKSTVSNSVSSSVQAAKNAASSFSSQTQSTYSNMQKLSQGSSQSQVSSTSSDSGSNTQFNNSFASMDKLAEQFGQKHGMSKGQAASMLLAASMDSNKMLVGMGFAAATGMGGSGRLGYKGESSSSETWDAAKQFASQNQFGQKWSSAVQAGERQSAQQSQNSNDSQSKDIQAGFNRQNAAQQNLQSSLTQAQAWQRLSSQMQESGGAGSVQAVGDLIRYGRDQGVNMEQLAAQSTSINGNSSAATQALQNVVSGFVQDRAAQMAGVGPASSSDGVYQAHQANNSAVASASDSPITPVGSGNVLVNAGQNMESVREMATQAGVPAAALVSKSADDIEQMVQARMTEQGSTVTQGASSVSSGGAAIQNDAESRSNPGNQNHVAHATGQVVSAGVDMITDGVDGLKQVGGQLMDGFIGKPNQSTDQANNTGQTAQGQWDGYNQDLPPGASVNNTEQSGKAWVNRLD